MKVLVTGANGYLGLGIVDELINQGIEVVATDFKTDRVNEKANRVNCDLFAVDDPNKSFDNPDVLLHLAWRDGFRHYSDAHINDLPLHYRFIKQCAESNIKKIVVMGSMHEVGYYEGCINEKTPCNPTTPYGISKNALRNLTAGICLQNNTLFQWLRGCYIVGNDPNGSSIFSKIALAAKEGKEFFPFTTGQNQFDFLEYEEFCKQVTAVIKQEKEVGIINICSGKPAKLRDQVEDFINKNGYRIKLQYGIYPERPYESKAIWGDNSIIKRIMSE